MSKAFTLEAAKPKLGGVLYLEFADGAAFDVDLNEIIRHYPSLIALEDPKLFKRAKVGEWGGSVSWGTDDLEMSADNLRSLAVEQSGGYSHERIVEWMHQHQLTQQQAADALGLSRRMLGYYLSGEKPIPKTVALAAIGWEHVKGDERFAHAV